MSVALLVESSLPDLTRVQTLITEYGNYHRLSTGSRGRGEAWKAGNHFAADYPVTKLVGMTVMPADERDLRVGKVTGLATKLQGMGHVNLIMPSGNHSEVVSDVSARVSLQDTSLSTYFRGGVMVFSSQSPQAQIISPAAPAPAPAPAVAVAAPAPAMPVMELASVPPAEVAAEYVCRKVGGVQEFAVYDAALRDRKNILIKGHAGSGKTMSVIAYAATRGYRYYNISSHAGVDTTQLFGKWNPTPDGSLAWCDGAVTHLVRHGGVLLINEVNFLPDRISTALFSLLDDRREIQLSDKDGEVIKAHPDLLIIADMNPNYRGTRPLNQAWADRFLITLDFPYDPTIERKLIKNTAVLELAARLRQQFDNDEIETPISTRGLVGFMRNMEALGYDFAVYSYLNKFAAHEQQAVRLVFDTYAENIKNNQSRFTNVDNYADTTSEGI